METQPDLSERLATILGDELEIERELGGGGMSRVFVAFDRPLNRRVVVKVLPDEIATATSRERFRREILTSATLQHPNIVPVISAGGGRIHFIMPFVDGFTAQLRDCPTARDAQRRKKPNGATAQRRKRGAQSASRAMVSCWRLR